MQRTVLVGALIIAFGLVAAALLGPGTAMGSTVLQSSSQPTGISVTGEGKLTLVPDMATVQLGVQAQARTVEEARATAAAAMERVIAALRAGGIAEPDIKTSHFSIQPQKRSLPNGTTVDEGYRVTNMVSARVKVVAEVGRIVDATAAAGGNLVRVDSVQFGLADPSRFQAELRELAMKDARGRAEQLARLGGKGLGEPVYIQEGGSSQPPVPVRTAQMSMAVADTAFTPGEMEVKGTVQVVWGIR